MTETDGGNQQTVGREQDCIRKRKGSDTTHCDAVRLTGVMRLFVPMAAACSGNERAGYVRVDRGKYC